MEASPLIFRDLTYVFVAAIVGGLIAWRLGLPLILGYVAGGIAISPFTPGPHLSQLHTFEVFAEAGVVLLMFSVGVEFSIADLLQVKWVAIIGGALGIACSVILAVGASHLLGWSLFQGVVVGATVSVASTMVLAKLLAERRAMEMPFARVMIGITLVEDLAVVVMTVLLPMFAGSGEGKFAGAAWTLGKSLLLLGPLILVSSTLIPRMLRLAKRTKNDELLMLLALAICLATAAVSHEIGFSPALGAFLAGISISGSQDLHFAHEKLLPLRDAFVALFFVSVGSLIEPRLLWHNLPLFGVMLTLIIAGKFLIWTGVVWVFRYPLRTAIAVAAGLTQIGELSFVVAQVARGAGLVHEDVFVSTLAASLVSIFLNVLIVRLIWPHVCDFEAGA